MFRGEIKDVYYFRSIDNHSITGKYNDFVLYIQTKQKAEKK